MLDREVLIPGKVEKIVGIRAGALRFLTYLDATEMIAGIEEAEKRGKRPYISAYPELLDLPVIGPSMGGDAELILKSGAEVIFMAYTTKGDAETLQKQTGIPVIAIECPEFGIERDTFYASLQLIGKVLNREGRADSLISYIKGSIEDLQARTTNITEEEKVSVYIGGVPYSGIRGLNSTQPYYPPLMFVNTVNVASDINKRLISHVKGTYIDVEQLLLWDPDFLFIDASGFSLVQKELRENPALSAMLTATKNNRIFTVLPYNNYAINYELMLVNAWYIGKVLYPSRFKDINMDLKAGEILSVFLGDGIQKDLPSFILALKPVNTSGLQ